MKTDASLRPPARHRGATVGWWLSDGTKPERGDAAIASAVRQVGAPAQLVQDNGQTAAAGGGTVVFSETAPDGDVLPLAGYVPALPPELLGDAAFRDTHRLRYAYVGGAMANGISSEAMVVAMARAGMLGFFGAAGLSLDRVEAAIDRIQQEVGDLPYGFNLIHTPNEPRIESGVADLYLRRGVRLVSASAYLDLTHPLVRYRVSGIHRDTRGRIVTPNRVIAKVSRTEVARKFLSPPPSEMLQELVRNKLITQDEATLASKVPVAGDLTAEADSGGHTDNRPACTLVPTMMALADEIQAERAYEESPRVGAAGGVSTPESTAAAFAMGAAYVLTGSVNQACVEAGTSAAVREMLCKAREADITMAPAADMFEMGVKVQVLKWGTMFAVRARTLYDLYRTYASVAEIPESQRAILERDFFRCTLAEAWAKTRAYFAIRDPEQVTRAERDPKHRMALVFRAYLGQSSDWANTGDPSRRADYQIWCGPAMGAFNEWVRGSFLESPEHRDVVTVGLNLLVGAGVVTRAAWMRACGVSLPMCARRFAPQQRAELAALFACA